MPPASKKQRSTQLLSVWNDSLKLRYLIVGGWNTAAGYLIFAAIYGLAAKHVSYLLIAALSHFLAVTQSFLTQRHLVFHSDGSGKREYLRFHIAHLGSLAAGLCLLPLLVEWVGLSPLYAQALVTLLIVIASFFVHQHYTFKKPDDA